VTRTTCALAVLAATIALCAPSPAHAATLDDTGDPTVLEEPARQVGAYLTDVRAVEQIQTAVAELQASIGSYLGEVERAEREQAARRAARPVPVPSARPTGTGSGSCYDGPIPAYIVTRESGGNPTAMNPSGAYGCFQIMPYVWSANCADLDRGVGGQIECANRISNGGSNLQPWALTR